MFWVWVRRTSCSIEHSSNLLTFVGNGEFNLMINDGLPVGFSSVGGSDIKSNVKFTIGKFLPLLKPKIKLNW